jgi:hypothetical protein
VKIGSRSTCNIIYVGDDADADADVMALPGSNAGICQKVASILRSEFMSK